MLRKRPTCPSRDDLWDIAGGRIGSFTVVCVVGVLGVIHCEYRQTFVLAMCGIVTFSM